MGKRGGSHVGFSVKLDFMLAIQSMPDQKCDYVAGCWWLVTAARWVRHGDSSGRCGAAAPLFAGGCHVSAPRRWRRQRRSLPGGHASRIRTADVAHEHSC